MAKRVEGQPKQNLMRMTRSNAKGNANVNQNVKGNGNKNVYTLDLKNLRNTFPRKT